MSGGYEGPFTEEFLAKCTTLELIALYRDLDLYPEDRGHAKVVYDEIVRRDSALRRQSPQKERRNG